MRRPSLSVSTQARIRILKLLDRAAAAVVFMDAKLAGQRNIEPLGLSRDGLIRRVYPGEIINESDSVAPV